MKWNHLALSSMIALGFAGTAQAIPLLNEFQPNPAGSDPATQDVELLGAPNTNFDLWILSIENDGYNGLVDRASNVTGSFDANGLAVVTINDLENPSNTVILTDSFTGSTSTDIDPGDDGVLDLSTIGTIFDALGVSDNAGDDATMYGSLLGGTDLLFNGQFEPLIAFRDGVTRDWYQAVTADFGQPTERYAVYPASGGPEIDPTVFIPDVTQIPTFGAINPTIPEPASLALLAMGGLMIVRRRR
jgi:hypothetical protein